MRARGANVTDIAVLVVAADDGVMPQTEEAISHARAAGVPIVVALNKIDLPGVDHRTHLQQLATNELLPSEWGGDVEVVKTSATTGTGIDELLETLLTVAELHEYKANPNRAGHRHVPGSRAGGRPRRDGQGDRAERHAASRRRHRLRRRPTAASRRCTTRSNRASKLEEAGPRMPVNVTGLDVAPGAGEHFYVLDDIAQAREIADQRAAQARGRDARRGGSDARHAGEPVRAARRQADDVADAQPHPAGRRPRLDRSDPEGAGQARASRSARSRCCRPRSAASPRPTCTLADASDAIIIGFNVVPDETARGLADERGVQIRRYDIIYKVTDDIKAVARRHAQARGARGRTGPGAGAAGRSRSAASARSPVAACFAARSSATAASASIRDSRIIGDYAIDTLKREKDDAKEVREGMECGIKLAGFNDIKEGDMLEAYKIEEVARTL